MYFTLFTILLPLFYCGPVSQEDWNDKFESHFGTNFCNIQSSWCVNFMLACVRLNRDVVIYDQINSILIKHARFYRGMLPLSNLQWQRQVHRRNVWISRKLQALYLAETYLRLWNKPKHKRLIALCIITSYSYYVVAEIVQRSVVFS